MPRSMLAPFRLARPETLSEAPAALVSAPLEVRLSTLAVLVPESCVAEPELMLTAPPVNVRPLIFAAAPLPRVIFELPALKFARPVTLTTPLLVIGPAAVISAVPEVASPERSAAPGAV